MKKLVVVNDLIQSNYKYYLTEPMGKNFDRDFIPELSPKEMLELGVFSGKYLNDCRKEFPKDWFLNAKLSEQGDSSLNFYGVSASQPLSVWIKNKWIHKDDPRGWFQWYCRYYMGRRKPDEDERQIKRWKAIKRHITQVKKTAEKETFPAEESKDKLYFTGHMIVERSDIISSNDKYRRFSKG